VKAILLNGVRAHAITLMVIALLISGVLASTRWATEDRILANREAMQQRLLSQLLSEHSYDNNPYEHKTYLRDEDRGNLLVYRAARQNSTHAIIVETHARDGYNGRIDMLIAVNRDLTVAGVRVTRHLETPGLGDDIDHRKSNWITSFNGRSLSNPDLLQWTVQRDGGAFDQFTGATITPRAVIKTVRDTLVAVTEQRDALFEYPLEP
jgi:electron transport complex protein RnfG